MRPIWKGAVSLGLVNIPVKMYAASEDRSLKFKLLHDECNTPLKYKRTCPHCDREVDGSEIVKGYEYQKERFVVLREEDFRTIQTPGTKSIDILDFCRQEEVDPIYYEKSYYLGPEETGKKAYNLLVRILKNTGRVAVAKIVIRTKQRLAVIRVLGEVLMTATMKYPDEIRLQQDVPGLEHETAVEERELVIAEQLVNSMTVEFDPNKYIDDYRGALLELIEKKLAGEEPVQVPSTPREGVADLMDSLRASLEAIEKERFTPQPPQRGREKGRVG